MKRLAFVIVLLMACFNGAGAKNFPERAVRIVVPFAPGGSTDVLARLVSLRLSETWRQPVIVENVPGRSSAFGTNAVATAPPDGHTLLAVNAALAMNEALSRNLPYHALRNFAPVSLLARQHLVLVVSASSPIFTVSDLIEAARAAPGQQTYATSGSGGLAQLASELFKLMTSTNLTHVPYKGARHILDELMAKHVSLAMVALPPALPYLKSGRLRAVAVAGNNRATALPDVPTIGASVAGYGISTWIGLLAPYGASVSLVRDLNADVQTVIRRPELVELLANLGYEARSSTPGDFQNRLRADIERYSRIVFDAGMAAQHRMASER